jgi:hypothetical protein
MLIKTTELMLMLVAAAGYVFAGTAVPEIDGSSAIAAVGLLSGGMVVLWGRRRK